MWHHREQRSRQFLVEVEYPARELGEALVPRVHVVCVVLGPLKPSSQIMYCILKIGQSGFGALMRNVQGLGWRARLRRSGLGKVVLPMHECVATGPSLDLTQAIDITTLEVAASVLELPEGAVWVSMVKHIAFWMVFVRIPVLSERASTWFAYLYGIRTCSAGVQRTRYSYA